MLFYWQVFTQQSSHWFPTCIHFFTSIMTFSRRPWIFFFPSSRFIYLSIYLRIDIYPALSIVYDYISIIRVPIQTLTCCPHSCLQVVIISPTTPTVLVLPRYIYHLHVTFHSNASSRLESSDETDKVMLSRLLRSHHWLTHDALLTLIISRHSSYSSSSSSPYSPHCHASRETDQINWFFSFFINK